MFFDLSFSADPTLIQARPGFYFVRANAPRGLVVTSITNGSEETSSPEDDSQRISLPRAADSRVSPGGDR